jgi:F-type H+-transporting ATPase subunit a
MEEGLKIIFTIPGLNIPVTEVIVMSWVVMIVIVIWAAIATRKLKEIPTGVQSSAEMVVETINGFTKNIIGHNWESFAPYIGTLGLYLALANTCGALFLAKPPTRDFSIPLALAIMTILIVIGASIKYKGIKGFLKSFFEPLWFLFPFNLMEYIIKPLSLSMRLFGNIFGAYTLMHMIIKGLPWAMPAIACLYFDLFDGGLQAFIFVFLTSLYISEAIEVEEVKK